MDYIHDQSCEPRAQARIEKTVAEFRIVHGVADRQKSVPSSRKGFIGLVLQKKNCFRLAVHAPLLGIFRGLLNRNVDGQWIRGYGDAYRRKHVPGGVTGDIWTLL